MANALMQTAVVNNKGLVRGNNEDNFYLDGVYMHRDRMDDGAFITGNCRNAYQLYAVCDGMGGTDSGEDASFCAVSELAARKNEYRALSDETCLQDVLRGMSEKVYDEAAGRGQKSGTTIAMILVNGSDLIIANVGDSRIYRFTKGILSQISVDHSKVQRMVSMGLMTPEQARVDPARHIISQYLGMTKDVRISPFIDSSEKIREGDIYLLCSDGLTDMVEDREIEAILKEGNDLGDTARRLVSTALKNGGRDNVTVMLLKAVEVAENADRADLYGKDYLMAFLTGALVLIGFYLAAAVADMVHYLLHG